MVLVQMPMCNEKEVYAASIAACCALEWPRNRFLIQVRSHTASLLFSSSAFLPLGHLLVGKHGHMPDVREGLLALTVFLSLHVVRDGELRL